MAQSGTMAITIMMEVTRLLLLFFPFQYKVVLLPVFSTVITTIFPPRHGIVSCWLLMLNHQLYKVGKQMKDISYKTLYHFYTIHMCICVCVYIFIRVPNNHFYYSLFQQREIYILRRVIWPLSETLLEEMVVNFEFKGTYYSTLHHGSRELVPLSNNVIGKEEFSAVMLYLCTS